MKELPTRYNPAESEPALYKMWERNGYFNPDEQPNIKKGKKPFTIIMPPPNANGSLHIGHAVFVTLEDIMIRYHRMKGEPTLWLPGADHAGFETQVVFEKKLEKEGKSRFDYDRHTLYKMLWDFSQTNKSLMENQLRKLGASCDWGREKFTLDEDIVKIVYQTFKKLYDDNLIYRSERPVNWCTKHQTSLSDLEVNYTEQTDALYYLKYGPITIATTRPETIFADVALAVNPKDKKYKKLIGQKVPLPLTKRKIPVIADAAVDPKFGTGALKITPAHDALDFEIGQRHHLEIFTCIDERSRLTELAGEFEGLKVLEARQKVVEKLEKEKLLVKIDDKYNHVVGRCYKCQNIIEPRILPQWFVKMDILAKIGLKAVDSGQIKFISKRYEKIYRHWLTNIRDWNISRQIVWGIRIPVWYCQNCQAVTVTDGKTPKECSECHSNNIKQDPDVFDTWFSSGQWPFAVLQAQNGLSSKIKNQKSKAMTDFERFYPTSVMETGWDILFFWVARMIMLGIYLTGREPFKYVYLHGLVRDKDRQKMSKSKGNVIDPLAVAEIYGADAVRMALVFGTGVGNDVIISEEKIRAMRNFVTKIWNAARFILMNLETRNPKSEIRNKFKIQNSNDQNNLIIEQLSNLAITPADKTILKRLRETIKKVDKDLDNFRFGQAAQTLYHFFWHEFCDVYIEESKKQLDDKRLAISTKQLLLFTLTQSLKLLHPFMPFITEEIYQNLLKSQEANKLQPKSIMISQWPLAASEK